MNELKDPYLSWQDVRVWTPEEVIADCVERLKQGLSKYCDREGLEPTASYDLRKDRWRECILGIIWMAKRDLKLSAH